MIVSLSLICSEGLRFITTLLPQLLSKTRSPCRRSTSLRPSGETSNGSYCGESAKAVSTIFS